MKEKQSHPFHPLDTVRQRAIDYCYTGSAIAHWCNRPFPTPAHQYVCTSFHLYATRPLQPLFQVVFQITESVPNRLTSERPVGYCQWRHFSNALGGLSIFAEVTPFQRYDLQGKKLSGKSLQRNLNPIISAKCQKPAYVSTPLWSVHTDIMV